MRRGDRRDRLKRRSAARCWWRAARSIDSDVRPASAHASSLDRIHLAAKTMMRDSWYFIFSLFWLAIVLGWLLFVTFAE
jgi:hypothetical protein